MNAADKLLPRLNAVREVPTRSGRARSWRAACPAHDDQRPSLDIDQLDDRLLLCCRAGCSSVDVVQSVGLQLSDLFDRPTDHHRAGARAPLRARIDPIELLRALDRELLVGAMTLLREGTRRPLDEHERDRLLLAAQRVGSACALIDEMHERPELRRLRRGERAA